MFRQLPALALFLVCASPAQAQGPRFASFVTLPPVGTTGRAGSLPSIPDSLAGRTDELAMGMGGLLAGLAGVVAGAYVGSALDRSNGCSEWCGLAGGLFGATAGSTLMVPMGVHLTNRQRGSFGRGVAWSALAAAASWGAAVAFQDPTPLLIMPFAQVVAAVAAEVATSPSPAE